MKKLFLFLLLLFFLFFPARAEEIKNFQSEVIINNDGTISVEEKIVYDFGTFHRHGIFRNIPFIKNNDDGKKF